MRTLEIGSIPKGTTIALAIGQSSPDQRHIGILYRRDAKDAPRFLHLAWHMDLRDDDFAPADFRGVVVADLPSAVQPTILAYCKRTASADVLGGLPYGFGYKPATVIRDPETDKLVLQGPSGLTCATFVLAMFDLADIQLADLTTWKDRDGDDAWKDRVIAALARRRSPDELEAVKRDKAHVRVRPEDTAGSATVTPLPCSFEEAVDRGTEILDELKRSA